MMNQLIEQIVSNASIASIAVCQHHHAKAFGLDTTPLARPVLHTEVYDFGSGCLCCSPDGDMLRVLQQLDAAPAADETRPTCLLIETTGVADPAPFVALLKRSTWTRRRFVLRAIVACVDVLRADGAADQPPSSRFRQQLEQADRVWRNGGGEQRSGRGWGEQLPSALRGGEQVPSWAQLLENGRPAEPEDMEGAALEEERDEACAATGSASLFGVFGGGGAGHELEFSSAVAVETGAVLWGGATGAEAWLTGLLASDSAANVLRLQAFLRVNRQESAICGGLEQGCDTVVVSGARGDAALTVQPVQDERVCGEYVLPETGQIMASMSAQLEWGVCKVRALLLPALPLLASLITLVQVFVVVRSAEPRSPTVLPGSLTEPELRRQLCQAMLPPAPAPAAAGRAPARWEAVADTALEFRATACAAALGLPRPKGRGARSAASVLEDAEEEEEQEGKDVGVLVERGEGKVTLQVWWLATEKQFVVRVQRASESEELPLRICGTTIYCLLDPEPEPEPAPTSELEPESAEEDPAEDGGQDKVFQRHVEDFECVHCGHLVRGLTGYENHCPQCLWSKHVDVHPGDRAATCQGLMPPVFVDDKNGEFRYLQRCELCGHERWNKRQDVDDFDAILAISTQHDAGAGRGSVRGGKQRGGRGRGKGGCGGGAKGGRGKKSRGK